MAEEPAGLQYGVTTFTDEDGTEKVLLAFPTPIHTVGLTKDQACALGRMLINEAGYRCRIELA